MRRRPATIARRSPTFDALESRCLLSFTNQWIAASPSSFPMAAEVRTMNWPGQVLDSRQFAVFPTCVVQPPGPSPTPAPSQDRDSGPPGSQPDQPPPTSTPIGGMGLPDDSHAPVAPVSQPANGGSQNLGQLQSIAPSTPQKGRLENLASANDQLLVVAYLSDGDATIGSSETTAGTNSVSTPATTSPLPSIVALAANQFGSLLLSIDLVATLRPLSTGDSSAASDRGVDPGLSQPPIAQSGVIATSPSGIASGSVRPGLSATVAAVGQDDFPGPASDDLIAAVLPFDSAAVKRAVDHFFQQLDELDVRDFVAADSTRVLFVSIGLGATAAALEVARRRLRTRMTRGEQVRVRDRESGGVDLGFPDLPGSWSSRLT